MKISQNWKQLQKTINYKKPVIEQVSKSERDEKIGKYLALDCEMVGVGIQGKTSVLARVSIVNYHGNVVLDEYVSVQEKITDFRTAVSGITSTLLKEKGKPFTEIQKQVSDLLKNKIVVGHSLKNDFDSLMIAHPAHLRRDTAKYKPFRNPKTGKPRALRHLVREELGLDIQSGKHSSVEDARAVMSLFKKHKKQWDQTIKTI